MQRESLDLLAKLNAEHQRAIRESRELEARIQNYELAARMQLAATDVLDLSKETEATKKLYGLDNPVTASYGTRCLMARRLVETGVRFVQVFVGKGQPWDHHEQIKQGCPRSAPRAGSTSRRAGQGSKEPRLARQHDRDVGGRVWTIAHHAERRWPRPQPQRVQPLVGRWWVQERPGLWEDRRLRLQGGGQSRERSESARDAAAPVGSRSLNSTIRMEAAKRRRRSSAFTGASVVGDVLKQTAAGSVNSPLTKGEKAEGLGDSGEGRKAKQQAVQRGVGASRVSTHLCRLVMLGSIFL